MVEALGFLGGTGPEGKGLSLRFAHAGHPIVIGSREIGRAKAVAKEISDLVPQTSVQGALNIDAAQKADIAFIAVPYQAQVFLLPDLALALERKIVVNVVAPLVFEGRRIGGVQVPEGSAAEQSQELLPRSYVVAAFQNLSAVDLIIPDRLIDGDVVVCSDHLEGKERVMRLAEEIPGIKAVDGGTLNNARYVEEITALLLNINRNYKGKHSMIRITGL